MIALHWWLTLIAVTLLIIGIIAWDWRICISATVVSVAGSVVERNWPWL